MKRNPYTTNLTKDYIESKVSQELIVSKYLDIPIEVVQDCIKNNHLITLMNPKTKKKIRKNIKRVIKKDLPNKENTFASYNGYFKNCSCKSFINHNDFDYFK